MSIKIKIAIITTLWLVGLMVVFNIIVYFAFIRIATESEQEILTDKAKRLLQKS